MVLSTGVFVVAAGAWPPPVHQHFGLLFGRQVNNFVTHIFPNGFLFWTAR